MSFLSPQYYWLLFLLVIPLIIHLLYKGQTKFQWVGFLKWFEASKSNVQNRFKFYDFIPWLLRSLILLFLSFIMMNAVLKNNTDTELSKNWILFSGSIPKQEVQKYINKTDNDAFVLRELNTDFLELKDTLYKVYKSKNIYLYLDAIKDEYNLPGEVKIVAPLNELNLKLPKQSYPFRISFTDFEQEKTIKSTDTIRSVGINYELAKESVSRKITASINTIEKLNAIEFNNNSEDIKFIPWEAGYSFLPGEFSLKEINSNLIQFSHKKGNFEISNNRLPDLMLDFVNDYNRKKTYEPLIAEEINVSDFFAVNRSQVFSKNKNGAPVQQLFHPFWLIVCLLFLAERFLNYKMYG